MVKGKKIEERKKNKNKLINRRKEGRKERKEERKETCQEEANSTKTRRGRAVRRPTRFDDYN